MKQNNTSFLLVAASVISVFEKQEGWLMCAILFIISTCVCVCVSVRQKSSPGSYHITQWLYPRTTWIFFMNYMNLKLILFYLFVWGSTNVCVWTRGQKRVSGVLLWLSPSILWGRISFLNPGLVFSKLGWSHQATMSLTPMLSLELGLQACARYVSCYVNAKFLMIVQQVLTARPLQPQIIKIINQLNAHPQPWQ